MSTTTQETNGAAQDAAPRMVTIEIAGLEIGLPLKFNTGHVLSETEARILDAAYQRQFTNNQNALAKSRAEAFSKATTDAERAAKQPLSAAAIAALYTDYEPNVGGTPRQSAMEKIRADAAWRFWTARVKAHNDAVVKGRKPIIVKAVDPETKKPVQVSLPSGKGAAEKREALITSLLSLPNYVEHIQEQIDAIMAERGTRKEAAAPDTVVSGNDLL